jgi:hypothetical protein
VRFYRAFKKTLDFEASSGYINSLKIAIAEKHDGCRKEPGDLTIVALLESRCLNK